MGNRCQQEEGCEGQATVEGSDVINVADFCQLQRVVVDSCDSFLRLFFGRREIRALSFGLYSDYGVARTRRQARRDVAAIARNELTLWLSSHVHNVRLYRKHLPRN